MQGGEDGVWGEGVVGMVGVGKGEEGRGQGWKVDRVERERGLDEKWM